MPIPDYSLTGVASPVTVAGIPAGAVINSVNIKFNITHTYDGDLVINLKAPNGNVLNLVDLKAGKGANFTNTNVNSLGREAFSQTVRRAHPSLEPIAQMQIILFQAGREIRPM